MTTIVEFGATIPARATVFTEFQIQNPPAPPSAALKMEPVAMLRVLTIGAIHAPLLTTLRRIEGIANLI